ncbi:MAG: hypothetical protein LBH20_09550 [Treponema sp.]|jgi:hypothetical protein|nr:hypothetical protein [Treponema sp.]
MEKKQKLFLGFTVMLIMVIFTMVGCDLLQDAEFPSEFIGTWERAYTSVYTNTLTFTKNTLKSSSQSIHWDLQSVSGNSYTMTPSSDKDDRQTITIKLNNGNLEFSNDRTGTAQDDWDGIWKRK